MSQTQKIDLFSRLSNRVKPPREMTLQAYLSACRDDPMHYASIHDRLLKAIGEPELIDTRNDARLGRLFMNRRIRRYKTFEDFFGMEDTIERLVDFLKAAAQGLEERKQILYLLGPVGSAKSSLAERIKDLAEVCPMYVLAFKDKHGKAVPSPLYESPLGIIPRGEEAKAFAEEYKIPLRFFTGLASPWAVKRLDEVDGDLSKVVVLEMYPSRLREVGIAKTEPGDDNNQDVSALVGKVNIRMLEDHDQHDPDAYSFSGALNKATQGVMEFVEMFKAPLKTLHPLLTATQEGNYTGTEAFGAMPYQGLILAHSNESEWKTFRGNKNNEAFLDRVRVIEVKYNLRLHEEQEIYKKLLSASDLVKKPCTPYALEALARVVVVSRLTETAFSSQITKARVYDGQNLKNDDPKAKPFHEYLAEAGLDEGKDGLSTRFAYKVLSRAFNSGDEVGLDVIELMQVLKDEVRALRLSGEEELLAFIDEQLKNWYYPHVDEDLKEALLEDSEGYCQNRFERYVDMADAWIQEADYKDPDTHNYLDKTAIDKKLSEVEKPAGIGNPKDFRSEVVSFTLRYKANNGGKFPRWNAYEKIARVIKHQVAEKNRDLLPLISFEAKRDQETESKFSGFKDRMLKKGYTELQLRRLVGWYQQMGVNK